MKSSIKTELWKAFHNPLFYISIALGMAIITADVVQNAFLVSYLTQRNIEAGFAGNGNGYISLFIEWIAVNGSTFGSMYFYIVWPVLAALPYGWSYIQEVKTGAINQYLLRSTRKKYFFSKYIAVFVSGGAAVAVPVLADLLLNALVCPAALPSITGLQAGPQDGWFLSVLFYKHPWAYCLIWCCMEFLFGGSAACMCFLTGRKLRYQVMTVLLPFAILYLLNLAGYDVVRNTGINLAIVPLDMAMAAPMLANSEWLVFSWLGALIGITLFVGYREVRRYELA